MTSPSDTGNTYKHSRAARVTSLASAAELLRTLLPMPGSPGIVKNTPAKEFVFRGQQSTRWKLQPTAMRDPTLPYCLTAKERAARELDLVARFSDCADEAGFPLPHDSPAMRVSIPSISSPIKFPMPAVHGLFALAQHYGVSTRLLDWSYQPLVAAYFAVADLARVLKTGTRTEVDDIQTHGRFAVFALSKSAERYTWSDGQDGYTLYQFSAPGATNPNLSAQRGCFTLLLRETAYDPTDPGVLPNLDQLMPTRSAYGGPDWDCVPLVYKFTVPISEAPKMLYLLDCLDVHAARLFPGLSGVRRRMVEQSYAEEPGSEY